MATFATGRVRALDRRRVDVQWITVEVGTETATAYALTSLVGEVGVGDEVLLNTTAVERNLGTGGAHVVVANLSAAPPTEPGRGHIMKLRYTPHQVDVGAWDEHETSTLDVGAAPFDGTRVVLCTLLSHVAAVAACIRHEAPAMRIGYVMTDGGALPLAMSDLVAELRARSILDHVATAGQAFGGDVEAVNVPSGVEALREAGCEVILVGIGPGHAGTGSTLGFSSLDLAGTGSVLVGLGARVALALRVSEADRRARHQGLSHHSATIARLTSTAVVLPVPRKHPEIAEVALASQRDQIVHMSPVWLPDACSALGLDIATMGRRLVDDHLAATHLGAAARWALGTED